MLRVHYKTYKLNRSHLLFIMIYNWVLSELNKQEITWDWLVPRQGFSEVLPNLIFIDITLLGEVHVEKVNCSIV